MDCIFCKIANGEIPTRMVYEDKIVSVFMDNNFPLCDDFNSLLEK